MRDGTSQIFHKLQATSYRPVLKPPPPTLPEGEGAFCWTLAISTSYELRATSRFPNPHPGPPQRGGSLRGRRPTTVVLLLGIKETRVLLGWPGPVKVFQQTTSHRPRATHRLSRFPGRGRPCRPRPGVHAGKTAQITSLLIRPPQATSYKPLALVFPSKKALEEGARRRRALPYDGPGACAPERR